MGYAIIVLMVARLFRKHEVPVQIRLMASKSIKTSVGW